MYFWGKMVKEFLGKINKDGSVTVPKSIRNLINLSNGDYVRVSIDKEKEGNGGE